MQSPELNASATKREKKVCEMTPYKKFGWL
jgi:hypothetical protein